MNVFQFKTIIFKIENILSKCEISFKGRLSRADTLS